MIEHLFGSNTRFRLLRFFLQHPENAYFVRELTRSLDVQINAIRREINILLKIGIIKEIQKTRSELNDGKSGSTLRKYYAIDPTCVYFSELTAMFIKDQTVDEQEFLKEVQQFAGIVDLFLLTGRFTNDFDSTSDMLLVGNIKPRVLEKLIKKHEKDYGFEIRYTIMSKEEYIERKYVMDKFLFSLFEGKHVVIIDNITDKD
jgi:hypothetical protein